MNAPSEHPHELVNKRSLNRHLSFAVGSLLGDICLHLLPEVYSSEGDKRLLGLVILAGILSFLSIEKIFEFTQASEDGKPNLGAKARESIHLKIVAFIRIGSSLYL